MPTYSHSRMAAFEQCPLKFYYQYIERPDIAEVLGDNIALVLGKAVHSTLEDLYKEVSYSREVGLEGSLEKYEEHWGKLWTDDVIIPQFDAKTWNNMGKKYLADYFNRYSPFDQEKTIALERRVNFKVGKYSIIGYVDRISETSRGHYQIRDYKTNKWLAPQKKFDEDRQLALYDIGLRQMFKDVKKVDLVWHMLHFDKEIVSRRTAQQLQDLKKATVGLIDTIESTEDFKPRESKLCEWCSFQDVCPKKKHVRATDAMTVRQFRKDEGVKLANRFIQTKLKLGEWAIKNNGARKSVLAYSEQHDTARIIGSKGGVSVSTTKRVSFDPKVEALLKKNSLWDEFSKLDSAALARAMQDLDPKLRKKIEKLGKISESKSVRVVKRR